MSDGQLITAYLSGSKQQYISGDTHGDSVLTGLSYAGRRFLRVCWAGMQRQYEVGSRRYARYSSKHHSDLHRVTHSDPCPCCDWEPPFECGVDMTRPLIDPSGCEYDRFPAVD